MTAKAAVDLFMLENEAPQWAKYILSIVFLLIGISVSVIAALDQSNRYEERAGELRSLATLCKDYDSRFMSDYKKYVDPLDPEITIARLQSLIELQNDSLNHIRQRSDSLGVDLSSIDVSYRCKPVNMARADRDTTSLATSLPLLYR